MTIDGFVITSTMKVMTRASRPRPYSEVDRGEQSDRQDDQVTAVTSRVPMTA
jgi:hypothetical protein